MIRSYVQAKAPAMSPFELAEAMGLVGCQARAPAAGRDHSRYLRAKVRLALEQFLDAEPAIRPVERVRDLLGRVASGVPDLGQRHREHLIRRLRRGE